MLCHIEDLCMMPFLKMLIFYISDTNVCVNYEANENGTVMGVFTCPLEIEPTEFIYCCGDKYAEYCCKKSGYVWKGWITERLSD